MTSSALRYSQMSSPQVQEGLKLIDRLSPLENGHAVLDIGCGAGYLASVLAKLVGPGGKVTGVDPDRERIRLAREQYGTTSNLEFMVGNGEEFPDGPYDIVFSNCVMHWIKDKEPVFKKVSENLRVGGKFAFRCVSDVGPLASQLEALMEPGKPKFKDFFHFCSPDVYEAIASRFKLQTEFKSVQSEKHNFSNLKAFMEWLYATTSGKFDYHSIDDTALDKFKESLENESVSHEPKIVTYVFMKV